MIGILDIARSVAWYAVMLWSLRVSVTPSIHLLLGLPLSLDDSSFMLYARAAGNSGCILIRWPNHFSLCFSMYLAMGVIPTVRMISSFLT